MISPPPISLLLVDDQRATLWGLARLIDGEWPRMTVAGEASDRETALRLAASTDPDVILLDLDLGGESSLDLLLELLASTSAQLLICTCLRDPFLHEMALRAGACGVVLKDAPAERLLEAITSVHRHRAARASSAS